MSRPRHAFTSVEQQYISSKDLTLNRLAGGVALEKLCKDIDEQTSPYYVDTRGPGEEYEFQTVTQIVDIRSVRKNRLRARGITPRIMQFALTNLVPSLLRTQNVRATDVDVDFSKDAGFVALKFADEDGEKLATERRAVWDVLSKLGKFSVDDIPWLARVPDLRLAYIPTDITPRRSLRLIGEVEAGMQAALPFAVVLAPAYDELLTVQPSV